MDRQGHLEVHLTAAQAAKLAELANEKGCDASLLAQQGIESYLSEEARFVDNVNLGEAELDRGEYFTHEEVGDRLERMFRPYCKSDGRHRHSTTSNRFRPHQQGQPGCGATHRQGDQRRLLVPPELSKPWSNRDDGPAGIGICPPCRPFP